LLRAVILGCEGLSDHGKFRSQVGVRIFQVAHLRSGLVQFTLEIRVFALQILDFDFVNIILVMEHVDAVEARSISNILSDFILGLRNVVFIKDGFPQAETVKLGPLTFCNVLLL